MKNFMVADGRGSSTEAAKVLSLSSRGEIASAFSTLGDPMTPAHVTAIDN